MRPLQIAGTQWVDQIHHDAASSLSSELPYDVWREGSCCDADNDIWLAPGHVTNQPGSAPYDRFRSSAAGDNLDQGIGEGTGVR